MTLLYIPNLFFFTLLLGRIPFSLDQLFLIYQDKENLLNSSITTSTTDWLTLFLLTFFVGVLGVHRFYVGKIGTGFLMLLTLGGLGVWFLVDLILVVTGQFTNKDGQKIPRT